MDIHNYAERFVFRFGNKAPREAALRMEELLISGDKEGHELWLPLQARVFSGTILAMQMGTSERMIQERYGHDQILDYENELAGGDEC